MRGTVLSAEYTVTSKETVPDPEHYGFILLNHCAVPDLPYTTVLVKLEEGADESAVQAAIEQAIPTALVVTTRTHGNVSTARGYAQMFHGLSFVFPVLAFSVAAMIVVSTLKRMIDKQRMEIGTLKELGYTRTMSFFWPTACRAGRRWKNIRSVLSTMLLLTLKH